MIDTTNYSTSIRAAERAYELFQQMNVNDDLYRICCSACVKEFELILEQSGALLKKCLKSMLHDPKAVDRLTFKDIFRKAAQHDLISLDQAEQWLEYRDSRNNTAHVYGKNYADETLALMPDFITDAKALEQVIANCPDD